MAFEGDHSFIDGYFVVGVVECQEFHWSMVVVKMRRKVSSELRGIGSVGPK